MSIILGGNLLQIVERLQDKSRTVKLKQLGAIVTTPGQPLYVGADGKLYLAQANSKDTMSCRYLSMLAGVVDDYIPVLECGSWTYSGFNFTPGNMINDAAGLVYVNNLVVGTLTQQRPAAAGSIVQVVGFASGVHTIEFTPSSSYVRIVD